MAKFCVYCGNQLGEEEQFCSSCGSKVENESSNNNQQPTNTTVIYNNTPVQTNPTNGLSIAGFVVSLISMLLCYCSLSPIGLILSIIGLVQVNKKSEGGKGFAIAGIIIGAIGVLVLILVLLLYGVIIAESINEVSSTI